MCSVLGTCISDKYCIDGTYISVRASGHGNEGDDSAHTVKAGNECDESVKGGSSRQVSMGQRETRDDEQECQPVV